MGFTIPNMWPFTGPSGQFETAPGSRPIVDSIKRVQADVKECDEDFPHRCPHCEAAAFVGLTKVDCKAQCRRSKRGHD